MGKKKMINNCITGVIFAIVGVIFLILTIAVPIALLANDLGDLCTSAETLRPGEQMYCKPLDLDEKWIGEYDEDGKGYVDIYKISNPSFTPVTRVGAPVSNSHSLYRQYKYYNFSVTSGGSLTIDVDCSSASSTELNVYVLTKKQFANARDSDGVFWQDKATPETTTCAGASLGQTVTLTGPNYYYVIFSSMQSVSFEFTITPSYTVYDLSSYSSKKCDSNKCDYKDMTSSEYIFIDYPYSASGPKWVGALIHNSDINWSAVLGAALVLAVITIICFAIAAVFLVKQLKKMGKLGKKAMKKAEKREAENNAAQMQAATPAAQPYPAQAYPADPNAQPYPGQPYPGQPYPGQPM